MAYLRCIEYQNYLGIDDGKVKGITEDKSKSARIKIIIPVEGNPVQLQWENSGKYEYVGVDTDGKCVRLFDAEDKDTEKCKFMKEYATEGFKLKSSVAAGKYLVLWGKNRCVTVATDATDVTDRAGDSDTDAQDIVLDPFVLGIRWEIQEKV